jgi:hypothetical protein
LRPNERISKTAGLNKLQKKKKKKKKNPKNHVLFSISFSLGMETPDNAQQPIRRTMNRSSFYMLLFLFSLLFFNFSDNGSVLNGKLTREDLLAGLKRERELLANVTFNTNVSNVKPTTSSFFFFFFL